MAEAAAATLSHPDKHSMLVVGCHVRIVNLVAASKYNGQVGIIRSFQSDSGRYNVQVQRKNLGVKPEKLVILCSNCIDKEVDVSAEVDACPRCNLPYCSDQCRQDDWNSGKHKAACIPLDLPEPPEPVLEADAGDETFERSMQYMNMAVEAGDDGRIAEEVYMLEALIEKDDKQPAAFFNLFQRYKESQDNKEKAFSYLQRAVALLASPSLGLPSDPHSVMSPPSQSHSASQLLAIVIKTATSFIADDRVIGRNDLEPEAVVLMQLLQLCEQIDDTSILSNWDRSRLHHVLGNALRKMTRNEEALQHLQLADAVLASENDHNFQALILIPQILAYEAVYSADGSQKQEYMRKAVHEARQLKVLTAADKTIAYEAEIILAKMLWNQVQLGLVEERETTLKEVRKLAESAYKGATEQGDEHQARVAKGFLDHFEK